MRPDRRILFVALAAASLLAGCAHVDRERFDALEQAASGLRDRGAAVHARVRRLQDAVFRAKVSRAPRIDDETLTRPAWLDTSGQFRLREEALVAVAEFMRDLRRLARRETGETVDLAARSLFSATPQALQTAKDLLAGVPALAPSGAGFGDMVTRLFPAAATVRSVLVDPAMERARRGDLLALMQGAGALIRERLASLAPGNETLAEYALALKTEYLGDAASLRASLSGNERYRFDQQMLDMLQEFDAAAADSASLTRMAELLASAYGEAIAGLERDNGPGESLRELLRQLSRTRPVPNPVP